MTEEDLAEVSLEYEDVEESDSSHINSDVVLSKGKGAKKSCTETAPAENTTAKQLSTLTEAILQLTKSMTNKPSVRDKRKAESSHTTEEAPAKKAKVAVNRGSSSESVMQMAGTSSMSDESEDCENMLQDILASTDGQQDTGTVHDKKSPDNQHTDPEDELLNELLREYESDDAAGDKLKSDQLTKLLDKMFRSKIADKTLKDKMERQLRPENCANVKATRVNGGIWRRLREHTKKRDLHMFKMQQALVKGIIPVARIADQLMTAKTLDSVEQVQSMKKMCLEALSLLTHVNYEVNIQRRFLMKPDIGKEYSSLCSPLVPFTDFLFGDDLQKQLKDIGDENKIGVKLNKNKHSSNNGGSYPGKGYNYNNNYNNKGSFRPKNSYNRGQSHPGKKSNRGNYQSPK